MPKTTTKTTINFNDQISSLTKAALGQTSISVDHAVGAIMLQSTEANQKIQEKQKELGGATGQPVGGLEIGDNDGYFRRYQNGIIYIKPPSAPCWVHGAILDKYLWLKSKSDFFLGYPITDELTTPDKIGRYNHFEGGSIYFTYETCAQEVHGAIRDKWAALGWEKSWLGYPKSDEQPSAEGGRRSSFQNGDIWFWEDRGAYDMFQIRVRYKGFYCFGETAGGPFSAGSDSPYILFGGVHIPPNDQPSAITTEIYNDINSGSSQTGDMELYRGIPGGMALGISLFVHHSGDPNQYLDLVKEGVVLAGKGVSEGCGALFGQDAVAVCQSIWATVSPAIVKFVNGLIPAGDTLIRNSTMTITHKDMVTLADTPRHNFWGIEYHFESELLSDGDASYKVYFDIERV